jgi:hypothetical protein
MPPDESVRQNGKRLLARNCCSRVAERRTALRFQSRRVARRATATGPTCLTASRRRVREDVRLEKKRFDPLGGQRRDFGKLNGWEQSADKRRRASVLVGTGGDRRNCTTMLGTARVAVDPLVQLR